MSTYTKLMRSANKMLTARPPQPENAWSLAAEAYHEARNAVEKRKADRTMREAERAITARAERKEAYYAKLG